MQPGPTCPCCGEHEPWAEVEDSDCLCVAGSGKFDVSASQLMGLFEAWGFQEARALTTQGYIEKGRWDRGQEEDDPAWRIAVDVEIFRGADKVRSVILNYYVDGEQVLSTSVLSSERLLDLVASVERTMRHPAHMLAA
jgi:hypothetical protein